MIETKSNISDMSAKSPVIFKSIKTIKAARDLEFDRQMRIRDEINSWKVRDMITKGLVTDDKVSYYDKLLGRSCDRMIALDVALNFKLNND